MTRGWSGTATRTWPTSRRTSSQRLCTRPYFGGCFTVLKPIAWAMQNDDTHPYYFGACNLVCTAPAMTQDTELEEML